jgi:hypothetical protein
MVRLRNQDAVGNRQESFPGPADELNAAVQGKVASLGVGAVLGKTDQVRGRQQQVGQDLPCGPLLKLRKPLDGFCRSFRVVVELFVQGHDQLAEWVARVAIDRDPAVHPFHALPAQAFGVGSHGARRD